MTATQIRTAARELVRTGKAATLAEAHSAIVTAEATAAAAAWRASLPADER